MAITRSRPHVTVAGIIEQAGRFLLVHEDTEAGLRINQPAGHLESGESLLQAVTREVMEETAHPFTPDQLIGVYHWGTSHGITYVRFAFSGSIGARIAGRALDQGIVATLWLGVDELRARQREHRSPLVLRCVQDYLDGKRYPLDLIHYVTPE